MRYRVVLTACLITEISVTNKSVINVSWLRGGDGWHGSGTGGDGGYTLIGALWGYGELLGVHCIGCLGIACLGDAVIRSILWICYECGIAS